ncbi:uncharacterized protein V6R79_016197 [Siganus canaliculatus]
MTEENPDAPSRLRFNNLTLDELSKELEKRTKETQRLQDEVENATKLTLERFGSRYGIHSLPEQRCCIHRFNVSDLPADSIISTHQQTATHHPVCGLDSLNQQEIPCHKQESAKDECLRQLSDLKLNKTNDHLKEETFILDKAITSLEAELYEVQMEKDVLSDLRLKDSRTHVNQMERMLFMLEELQNIKRIGDQKLQVTEHEAQALNRRVETLEQNMKEMLPHVELLPQKNQCGDNAITSTEDSKQLSPAAKLTEEYNDEADKFVNHWRAEGWSGISKQNIRLEELITCLGQEMALLTDKLSSSKEKSVDISAKVELLKKLAERQTSLHQCQINELVSALSNHQDKVCCQEQQLIQFQSQLVDAQRQREQSVQRAEGLQCQLMNALREKERSLQQAEELQSHLSQLKRCGEQQERELLEEIKVLRGQLEVAREQLCKGGEESSCLQALLEKRAQEGRKSQELLEEKDKEIKLWQQEAQQHLSRLEEAQNQFQIMQADRDTLRLKLDDHEKMTDIMRLQMERSIHLTVQHSHTIDTLHQENSLLSNQLNQHKLELQQLRSDLTNMEHEKQQLQASVAEQSQRVQEESLEKQQLTAQLELQHMQVLTLKKEFKQLQQLHSSKKEEHKGVVLKLQSQLRSVHVELDQVRSTLTTLEGVDGLGLQAAVNMQEKITARREQIDSLQGKLQHLEETMEKLHQEKRYQAVEYQRQFQEFNLMKKEKTHLAQELEALRSKDKQLMDRIGQLEAIIHKISESFADCQDFIQLQEQDFFRLKLRHALDLKELQDQNLHTVQKVHLPHLAPPPSSALTAPPSSQHVSNSQITRQHVSPIQELQSLVKELRAVISENPRPHTDNNCLRRRSAPERIPRTTFTVDKAEEDRADSRFRRKTCGSEPQFLKTAELNGTAINSKSFSESPVVWSAVNAAWFTSSPQLLSYGRRSPVHSLLTSDPNSKQ